MFKTMLMNFLNVLFVGPQLVRHEGPGKQDQSVQNNYYRF
jgi:hypothetical protein